MQSAHILRAIQSPIKIWPAEFWISLFLCGSLDSFVFAGFILQNGKRGDLSWRWRDTSTAATRIFSSLVFFLLFFAFFPFYCFQSVAFGFKYLQSVSVFKGLLFDFWMQWSVNTKSTTLYYRLLVCICQYTNSPTSDLMVTDWYHWIQATSAII